MRPERADLRPETERADQGSEKADLRPKWPRREGLTDIRKQTPEFYRTLVLRGRCQKR